MKRKIAILDLGTNTFHILVVEIEYENVRYVYKEKIPVKIGQGGISHGYIIPEAEDRAINTIKYFKKILHRQGVSEIYANATSAFRNAKNGNELVERINKVTGIEVNVISGDKEAEYIYYGVKKALDIGNEVSLIMDIGGGSVEFVICTGREIYWKESFEIGAQRLLDNYHQVDPILTEDLDALEKYLGKQLDSLKRAAKKFRPTVLIGSSGTFDTLGDICRFNHNLIKIPGQTEYHLPLKCYREIHQDLLGKNKTDRLKIPGMIEMRVDMIVVSSALINFVVNSINIQNIRVSSYSLKEGVLQDILSSILV